MTDCLYLDVWFATIRVRMKGLLQRVVPMLAAVTAFSLISTPTAARGHGQKQEREQKPAVEFQLTLRGQQEDAGHPSGYSRTTRSEVWPAEQTAFIVCDVWDKHHSLNAVRRLEEFLPRLNDVLNEARRRGAVIIHAPSDCMLHYQDHVARQRAIAVPRAAGLPDGIEHWCSRIPAEEHSAYPIDQSDGGADDDPEEQAVWTAHLVAQGRNPGTPWLAQSPMIQIDDGVDYISDRGDEVWSILQHHRIQHVVLTGVHTNMCVLGRPFGLRQLVQHDQNVVLMRDMTDCMYNPARWPYVDHFTGNDLIISHVERFVCSTITSDQILGGEPFQFAADQRAERDLTHVTHPVTRIDLHTPHWTVVTLPASWADVHADGPAAYAGTSWYRCTLRLTDGWVQDASLQLRVQPPARGSVTVWLNGRNLKGNGGICLACADLEPVVFDIPTDAVLLNDANLLVIRMESQSLEKRLLGVPKLLAGDRAFSPSGRWQVRLGDDPAFSNLPLPAKFGTSTDIVYEPME